MSIIDEATALVSEGAIHDANSDLLFDVMGAIRGDVTSVARIIYKFTQNTALLRESLFWSKLRQYLNGVFVSDNDRANLCAKLVENGSSSENSKRLLECIDRAETSQKIQYLINATRCFLADFIDRTTFFRICRAITNTIDEDLLFVREHLNPAGNMEYTDSIQGPLVSGLVTFSVIGGDTTLYAFTPLAESVDRFAISYNDIERYPNPTENRLISAPNLEIPTATDDEVQEMYDGIFGEGHPPTVRVEIPIEDF